MWDTIKDYMYAFLGVLFLGIPLIGTLLAQRKKAKDRKTKRELSRWLLAVVVGCLFLIWLGYDKINRDQKKEESLTVLNSNFNNATARLTHSDSLNAILTKKVDSSNAFMKALKESFNIVKDANNKPVKYETKINTARDVYIGDRRN